MSTTAAADPDQLVGLVRRASMLEALREGSLRREELEQRVDVSTTTFYRHLNWLRDQGTVVESTDGIVLTRAGEILAKEVARFETTVLTALCLTGGNRDVLLDLVGHAPGLEALATGPHDRRELERHLDVSRTTVYRFTRTFEELGVAGKRDGRYALTAAGTEVATAVATFDTRVRTALRLEPVLEAVSGTTPAFDLDAFADATVTTTEHGDAHSPVNRCIRLIQETDSLRAVDVNSIVPLYLGDLQRRIVDGMETETIIMPEVVANILVEYPDRCIEACESGYLTSYLHEDLSYSLVVLDDRVGIGVRDRDARTLQMFVDTDSPGAREWAEAVFESYRANATRMDGFTPWSFRRAMERLSFGSVGTVDR